MSTEETVGTKVPGLEEVMWFFYDLRLAMGTEYALPWKLEQFPDFPGASQKDRGPIDVALVGVYHTLSDERRDYVRLLVGDALRHTATVYAGLWETLTTLRVAQGIDPTLITHEVLHVLLTRPYCGEPQAILVGLILRLLHKWGTANVLTPEEWCRVADVVNAPDIFTLIQYQKAHVPMATAERERLYEVLRQRVAREGATLRDHGQAPDLILKMLS